MQANIRFPIHFKAKPKRARSLQNVVTSYSGDYEIPEVSESDVDTVFVSRFAHVDDDTVGSDFRIVHHEGRIFRQVSEKGKFANVLGKPFSESWWDAQATWTKLTRRPYEIASNPLTRTLQKQIGWRLMAEEKGDARSTAYPPNYPDTPGQAWEHTDLRAKHEVGDLVKELSEIDAGMIEDQITLFRDVASKLLLIDDRLWLETPPPAIVVGYDSDHSERTVFKRLLILPEGPMPQTGWVAFPLERKWEADAYADRLAELAQSRLESTDIHDISGQYETSDGDHFWFDQAEREISNLALNLTLASARTLHTGTANYLQAVRDTHAHDTHLLSLEKLRCADFVRGEVPDMNDVIDDAITVWNGCRRPWGQMSYSGCDPEAISYLFDRVAEHRENAPISIHLGNRP